MKKKIEVKTVFLYRCILGIIYFWVLLFGWAAYEGGKEAEVERGALMSNFCLISHRWYDVEKLPVPDSSNLNFSFSGAQQKVLC